MDDGSDGEEVLLVTWGGHCWNGVLSPGVASAEKLPYFSPLQRSDFGSWRNSVLTAGVMIEDAHSHPGELATPPHLHHSLLFLNKFLAPPRRSVSSSLLLVLTNSFLQNRDSWRVGAGSEPNPRLWPPQERRGARKGKAKKRRKDSDEDCSDEDFSLGGKKKGGRRKAGEVCRPVIKKLGVSHCQMLQWLFQRGGGVCKLHGFHSFA